jgi:3-oxoacyl-[acyl-carrier-protein] synthase III
MRRARIVGTGMYAPPTLVTNAALAERLGRPVPEAVEKSLGIFQHYVTGPDLSAADLGVEAARAALTAAGIPAEDIDLVIVTTDTPEYISPPTASVVQGRIGAVNAGTFDVNGACSGFAASLNVASRMIGYDETYSNVLVIGVYNMSKYANQDNEFFGSVFGDGGGAVVLQATDEDAGYLASEMWADGTYHDYFGVFVGGTKFPLTVERFEKNEHLLRIDKYYPPTINTDHWPGLVRAAVAKAGLTVPDIDHIVFTQINRSTIEFVMQELGLPPERTTITMDKYGYTGSACIPIALTQALAAGKIRRGDVVVLLGSGVGAAMAVDVFRW